MSWYFPETKEPDSQIGYYEIDRVDEFLGWELFDREQAE